MFFHFLTALLAGMALASQSAINSQLAKGLLGQPLVASAISFAIGTVVLFVICLWKADLSGAWQHLPEQAWWKWVGGILGAWFVFTIVYLAPKIGMTNMLFFVIVGQLLMAAVIDHFALFGMPIRPLELWHILGLLVMALGLGLFFFGKRWFS